MTRRPFPPQTGLAIGTLILAILLMASLGTALVLAARQGGAHLGVEGLRLEIMAQAQILKQRVLQCVADYPAGDNGDAGARHRNYPAGNPSAAPAGLSCPGAGGASLWAGTEENFAPATPRGTGGWLYSNLSGGADPGVLLKIAAQTEEAESALAQVAAALAATEAVYDSGSKTLKIIISP